MTSGAQRTEVSPTLSSRAAVLPRPQGVTESAESAEILIFGLTRTTAAMIVMFLVAVDAWTTLNYLGRGWGYELNPAMAWLTHHGGAGLFFTAKLILSGLCMLWVVRRASREHARIATCCAFAIYGGVMALHIYNSMTLGDAWATMVLP